MVIDTIHPGVVAQFVNQTLSASAAWTAIHGDRLYEDVRFPAEPEYPLAVVTVNQAGMLQWAGKYREFIDQLRTSVNIWSIRQYPFGEGSWFDFADSFHAMRDALTGVGNVEVVLNGDTIGRVYISRFVREIKQSTRSDDSEWLYHGIEIEVHHK